VVAGIILPMLRLRRGGRGERAPSITLEVGVDAYANVFMPWKCWPDFACTWGVVAPISSVCTWGAAHHRSSQGWQRGAPADDSACVRREVSSKLPHVGCCTSCCRRFACTQVAMFHSAALRTAHRYHGPIALQVRARRKHTSRSRAAQPIVESVQLAVDVEHLINDTKLTEVPPCLEMAPAAQPAGLRDTPQLRNLLSAPPSPRASTSERGGSAPSLASSLPSAAVSKVERPRACTPK